MRGGGSVADDDPLDPRSDLWEAHADWWQTGFTEGADPEYVEQILPLARRHLTGAGEVLDVGTGEGQIARLQGELAGEQARSAGAHELLTAFRDQLAAQTAPAAKPAARAGRKRPARPSRPEQPRRGQVPWLADPGRRHLGPSRPVRNIGTGSGARR